LSLHFLTILHLLLILIVFHFDKFRTCTVTVNDIRCFRYFL